MVVLNTETSLIIRSNDMNFIKAMVPSWIKTEVKLLIHSGNRFICPFCGYSSRDFAPIGFDFPVLSERQVVGGGRRNSLCFKCKASERERLIFTFLVEKMGLPGSDRNKRLLHIAPERHLMRKIMEMNFLEYICGDKFADGYTYPVNVQRIDILDIPVDDGYFDLIICNHVLEHIVDDRSAMRELCRVLNPRGTAILQVPISKNSFETFEDFTITRPEDRERMFGQFDHVRIYGQDYVQRLGECGFHVNIVNISAEFEKFGLNMDENIYLGTKVPM